LTGLLFLAAALWNGLRLEQSLLFGRTLADYHIRPGTVYLAFSGGFWLITGLILFVALWSGRKWSRTAAISAVCAYAAWYWFDRLVLQVLHNNWPFSLAITFVVLIVVLFALVSAKTARFLGQIEAFQRQSKSQASG
jgi:predicted PurR-regulated permease PerM